MRSVAVALIAILLVGTNAAFHGADDVCDAVPAAHSADGSAAASARPVTPEPEHCAICHWLQAFRAGSISNPLVPFAAPVSRPAQTSVTEDIVAAARFTLPLRAPPA